MIRQVAILTCTLTLTACKTDRYADYPQTCHPPTLLGATVEKLIKDCGQPRKKNHNGEQVQWVYGGRYDLYVYVYDGVSIHDVQWSEYR